MALLIDILILNRPIRDSVRSLLPWFLLAIPFLILAPLIQPAADVAPAPLWSRPLIAGDALAFYLWKILWPFGLTVDYARSPREILKSGVIYWTWLFPAAIAIGLVVARRQRMLIAGALLFVAGLLPVLGFTTFLFQRYSTVADRFVYLSMFGIALAAAWVVAQIPTRPLVTACVILLIFLGVRSTMQALTWRNRRTLYGHAVRVSPHSASAHSNWGIVLSNAGDPAAAEAEYRRAIELDPDFLPAHYNLGGILRAQGRMEELERERKVVEEIKSRQPGTQPSQ